MQNRSNDFSSRPPKLCVFINVRFKITLRIIITNFDYFIWLFWYWLSNRTLKTMPVLFLSSLGVGWLTSDHQCGSEESPRWTNLAKPQYQIISNVWIESGNIFLSQQLQLDFSLHNFHANAISHMIQLVPSPANLYGPLVCSKRTIPTDSPIGSRGNVWGCKECRPSVRGEC